MITIKAVPSAARDIGEVTLKQGPARLLAFLEGARQPAIGTLLKKRGFSQVQFKEGWALLRALENFPVTPASMDDPGEIAVAHCEAFQDEEMACARAILERSHPDQAAYLFRELVAGKGVAAALTVSTFLQRVQSLSSRGESKAEQKADAEAVAILSQTGVTTSRRKELAQAVAELESSASDGTAHDTSAQMGIERLDALRRIHAWVAMWGDVARTVVTRRDQLIMLGLAKRRSSKRESAPVAAPANGAATPVTDDAAPPSRAA